MRSMCRVQRCAILILACALGVSSAVAGTRPQVDLSVSVSTTPEPFVPGGVVTVTMMVRNEGPDTAGATLPGQKSIAVLENSYDITTSPPPYVLFEPSTGCSAYAEESEPVFPGPRFFYSFSFWFDPIGPGESRTCTYRLRVGESTRESFDTYWLVHTPNDDDVDPADDRFDYTFVAAPPAPPAPVPSGRSWGWAALGLGLWMTAWRRLGKLTKSW